jgi:hypothetical protein
MSVAAKHYSTAFADLSPDGKAAQNAGKSLYTQLPPRVRPPSFRRKTWQDFSREGRHPFSFSISNSASMRRVNGVTTQEIVRLRTGLFSNIHAILTPSQRFAVRWDGLVSRITCVW